MSNVTCPECAAEFELDEGTEENEIIVCPDCGVDLEVTSLDPTEVELAPMEEEDWGEQGKDNQRVEISYQRVGADGCPPEQDTDFPDFDGFTRMRLGVGNWAGDCHFREGL